MPVRNSMYVPTVGDQRFLADLQQLHVREGNYSSVSRLYLRQCGNHCSLLLQQEGVGNNCFFVEFLYV